MTCDEKPGFALIMDLVDRQVALLPAMVSPFGELELMFTRFLYGTKPSIVPYDDAFFNKSQRLNTPAITAAKAMAGLTLLPHLNNGVLPVADSSWRRTNGVSWYGATCWDRTPRLWACNMLAIVIADAFGDHLVHATHVSAPCTTCLARRHPVSVAYTRPGTKQCGARLMGNSLYHLAGSVNPFLDLCRETSKSAVSMPCARHPPPPM